MNYQLLAVNLNTMLVRIEKQVKDIREAGAASVFQKAASAALLSRLYYLVRAPAGKRQT